jgi:glutathione S-transferase
MIELFIDYYSQPSRAVLIYCMVNNIPHVVREVSILAGEQRKRPFAELNPFKKVPAIRDGAFVLAESHAIIRYLHDKYKQKGDRLIPDDLQAKAKVDMYMDYHLTGTRRCGNFIFFECFSSLLGTKLPKNLPSFYKEMLASLAFLDRLLEQSRFLVGESLTVADIICYCEVMELKLLRFDYSRTPHLKAWMGRVEEVVEVRTAHERFNEMAASFEHRPTRDYSSL